jgi:formylglycine-generating enzyme required for sulfatase activity
VRWLDEDSSTEYEVIDAQGKARTVLKDGTVTKMTIQDLVAELRVKHPTLFEPSPDPSTATPPVQTSDGQKPRRGKRQGAKHAAPTPEPTASPRLASTSDDVSRGTPKSGCASPTSDASSPAPLRQVEPARHEGGALEQLKIKLTDRLHQAIESVRQLPRPSLGTSGLAKGLKPVFSAGVLVAVGFGGSFAYRSLVEPSVQIGGALAVQAQPISPPVRVAAKSSPAEPRLQPAAAPVAPAELRGGSARAEPSGPAPVFRDCSQCPEMVELPGGPFSMGSKQDASERPVHPVTLRGFAIGRFAVTVGEWKQCVAAKACAYEPSGSDNLPVRNLSWDDAQQYVAWLSKTTQKRYRLPTEAEWEYAARGGTATKYYWGSQMVLRLANCKGCGEPYDALEPLKVGSFAPNPFGLHDMAGGVEQWVADCWQKDYTGAARDGSARESKNCRERVLRGGSWKNEPAVLRSAARAFYDATVRYPTHGLRVARSD